MRQSPRLKFYAATHRDLEVAIEERAFREDLYYRLNVINLQLPPLRERNEDIVRLAEHLLLKHAVPGKSVFLTPKLKQAMTTYHWPGNVRELENVIRKLTVLRVPDLIAARTAGEIGRQGTAFRVETGAHQHTGKRNRG
jgi:transcriptional regulator with PAS, ATPase and Fis domain